MSEIAVVGGGIAGLTAAWELVRAGATVRLYEASGRLGGALSSQQIAGIRADAGAEAFSTRSTSVTELINSLGLGEQVVSPNPVGAWLQLTDAVGPMPATGILGIPGDPEAPDVARLVGKTAAARAAEDLTSPMTGWAPDAAPTVGAVVRDRMGEELLTKLVSPITSGVHSTDPDALDLNTAAPGLYAAMLEHGSLARAVTAVKAAAPAGSAVQSLRGGMSSLIPALENGLRQAGAELFLNRPVENLNELNEDRVLLAVDGPSALTLLNRSGIHASSLSTDNDGELLSTQQDSRGVALVTLAVHAPGLDSHPRGTGMLVAPDVPEVQAKAMTHVTSKWEWAAEAMQQQWGPEHHLVRLSYGRITDSPDSPRLGFHSPDEVLREAAIADLPLLTGVPLSKADVLDSTVLRWQRALPSTTAGHRQRATAVRAALAEQRAQVSLSGQHGQPKIWTAGTWFAGTGLARVIPDARRTAAEMLS